MTFKAPSTLPAGFSFINAVSGLLRIALIRNASGDVIKAVVGTGDTKEAAQAQVLASFYATQFDRRSLPAHIQDTKWVQKAGEKSKRIAEADMDAYLADGWTKGKGDTGPNVRTTSKVEAAPVVEAASA